MDLQSQISYRKSMGALGYSIDANNKGWMVTDLKAFLNHQAHIIADISLMKTTLKELKAEVRKLKGEEPEKEGEGFTVLMSGLDIEPEKKTFKTRDEALSFAEKMFTASQRAFAEKTFTASQKAFEDAEKEKKQEKGKVTVPDRLGTDVAAQYFSGNWMEDPIKWKLYEKLKKEERDQDKEE